MSFTGLRPQYNNIRIKNVLVLEDGHQAALVNRGKGQRVGNKTGKINNRLTWHRWRGSLGLCCHRKKSTLTSPSAFTSVLLSVLDNFSYLALLLVYFMAIKTYNDQIKSIFTKPSSLDCHGTEKSEKSTTCCHCCHGDYVEQPDFNLAGFFESFFISQEIIKN